MNRLLIVIPFSTDNAILAERLCDWIFRLSGKEQGGHVLLVCDEQVNEELRMKVKIAAEVAFSAVDLVVASEPKKPTQISAHYWTNLMFFKAAEVIQQRYRWPWVWLEPECVPVSEHWVEDLVAAYESQPKRYMGTHMKMGDVMFLSRVAVYPPGTGHDMREASQSRAPFEIASAEVVFPKSSRTRVFQHLKVADEADVEKVREESSIVVGDSVGILIEHFRESKPRKRLSVPIKNSKKTVRNRDE